MLKKTVQAELAALVDKHCHIETFCNNDNANDCRSRCYNMDWLEEATCMSASMCRHTWLHPPAGREKEALLHYLRQKRQDLPNTTACIVLPTSTGQQQPWTNLIKGMVLLGLHTTSSRIFRRCQEGGKYAGGNVDVWYDPPKDYPPPPPLLAGLQPAEVDHLTETCLAAQGERPDMLFAAAVGTSRTLVVVDTGATGDFITRAQLQLAQLPMRQSASKHVSCAGNTLAGILGEAKVPYRMGPHSSKKDHVRGGTLDTRS